MDETTRLLNMVPGAVANGQMARARYLVERAAALAGETDAVRAAREQCATAYGPRGYSYVD